MFLNRADIEHRRLTAGQWVDLVSHFEGETRRAVRFKVVPYEIPVGCAAAYFPETNVLVPIRHLAGTPQTSLFLRADRRNWWTLSVRLPLRIRTEARRTSPIVPPSSTSSPADFESPIFWLA